MGVSHSQSTTTTSTTTADMLSSSVRQSTTSTSSTHSQQQQQPIVQQQSSPNLLVIEEQNRSVDESNSTIAVVGSDDSDSQTIARLLQQLIQSGQVRILNGSTYNSSNHTAVELRMQDDDDDDDYDDDSVNGSDSDASDGKAMVKNRNLKQSSVDKEINNRRLSINKNTNCDIMIDIALKSGEQSTTSSRTALDYIQSRQIGMASRRKCRNIGGAGAMMPTAIRCAITNKLFLPNRRRIVDKNETKIFCCHYANNGNVFLTASQDQEIRLYEKSGKRQQYRLFRQVTAPNVGWSILDLAVSPDGRHVIYGTWSELIHQCNIVNDDDPDWRAFNINPNENRFAVFSIRFSVDGSEILAGASDHHLYIYNRESNCSTLRIRAHEDDVNAVCFADSSSHIIFSGADDGLCKVWDRRTLSDANPSPVGVLAGHLDGITFIDSRGDGRHLITNSKDQTIKLWDIRKFSSKATQDLTRAAVAEQKWDYRFQSAPRVASRPEKLEGDTSLMTYRGHSVLHTLVRAHFSPEHTTGQRFIYTGCARGQCLIYDLLTGKVVKKLAGHRGVVRDAAWHPYENEIATSSWDGVAAIWRYDERADRNINPDSIGIDGCIGDEDSCDEDYHPINCGASARYGGMRLRKRRCRQSSNGDNQSSMFTPVSGSNDNRRQSSRLVTATFHYRNRQRRHNDDSSDDDE